MRGRESTEDRSGFVAKQKGSRADANFDVVDFILVRVDGIVEQCPTHAARVQGQSNRPIDCSCDC